MGIGGLISLGRIEHAGELDNLGESSHAILNGNDMLAEDGVKRFQLRMSCDCSCLIGLAQLLMWTDVAQASRAVK